MCSATNLFQGGALLESEKLSSRAYNSLFYSAKSSDTRVILVKAVQSPVKYLTLLSSTLIYMSMKKITNKNAVLSTDCLFNIETHA